MIHCRCESKTSAPFSALLPPWALPQTPAHLAPATADVPKFLLSILFSRLAVLPLVLFLCPLTGKPMACCLPVSVPIVRWWAISARICRRRSSSIRREVMGSEGAGGGSRAVSSAEEEEGAERRAKGRRGVEGRGAAAGAERRAERALSCGSERSATRSWSWNCRRAMMRAEVWWLMP